MSDGDWLAAWMRDADGTSPIQDEAMLARLRRGMFEVRDAEARVGRYHGLEEIGRGGMSIVYRARDEVMGRAVVLKVLRHDRSTHDERLRREAAALASVSHPNVVQVLEVGRDQGQTFVVMEHVPGTDAAQWLAAEPRPWREVLRVFLEAGAGLAAVHEAGVVHRDFKPSNVLVGDDGRTRVADFGLAGLVGLPEPLPSSVVSPGGDRWDGASTRTGATMGTPRYMAPEQRQGSKVDPRADQWSFAVSLWEAMYGRHPLAEDDGAIDLRRTGPFVATRGAVPAAIGRVLARGLSVDPDRRFSSMGIMLERLRAAAGRSLRGIWVTAAVIGGVGLLAWWLEPSPDVSRCDPAEHSGSVWSTEVRIAVEHAFESTGLPYARQAFDDLDASVMGWVAGWNDSYRHACEAASAADARADLELACLRGALTELHGQLRAFASADREVVTRAGSVARDLAEFERCGVDGPRGVEPALRVAHEERMAIARASHRSSDHQAAARQAEAAAGVANDPHLVAEAQLLRGVALKAGGDLDGALAAMESAYYTAASVHDAELSARGALARLELAIVRAEHDEAEDWIRHARTWLERVELDREELELELAVTEGDLRHEQGRYDEALAALERARSLVHDEPDHPVRSRLFNLMGLVHTSRGDLESAERWLRRSYEQQRILVGDGHPALVIPLENLGTVYWHRGDYEQAETFYREAFEVNATALGDDHPKTASSRINLGLVADAAGRPEHAVRHFEGAIESLSASLGPEHPRTALAYDNLSATLISLRQWERAEAAARRAVEIYETSLEPGNPQLINAAHSLALALGGQGHHRDALASYDRELAMVEAAHGRAHPFYLDTLLDTTTVLRHLGDPEGADARAREALDALEGMEEPDSALLHRAWLARALAAVASERYADAVEYAEHARSFEPSPSLRNGLTSLALARGLWATTKERARVEALLDEARASFDEAGHEGAEERAVLERWVVDVGL